MKETIDFGTPHPYKFRVIGIDVLNVTGWVENDFLVRKDAIEYAKKLATYKEMLKIQVLNPKGICIFTCGNYQ